MEIVESRSLMKLFSFLHYLWPLLSSRGTSSSSRPRPGHRLARRTNLRPRGSQSTRATFSRCRRSSLPWAGSCPAPGPLVPLIKRPLPTTWPSRPSFVLTRFVPSSHLSLSTSFSSLNDTLVFLLSWREICWDFLFIPFHFCKSFVHGREVLLHFSFGFLSAVLFLGLLCRPHNDYRRVDMS